MASPGKIELAMQLSPTSAAEHRRWIQMLLLRVAFTVIVVLAALNVVLALV